MKNGPSSGRWRIDAYGVAFALLWIFIFCVPWEEEVALPAHVAVSHFAGAGAAAAGLLACIQRRRIRRFGSVHYIAGALVLWGVLSYTWSIAPDLTSVRASSNVQLFLMVWLIWEFAGTYERQLSLLAAFVSGTWVAAISTIYSFVTGTGTNLGLSEGRYTAAGSNENEVGIAFALGIGMSCYLLSSGRRPRFLWFAAIPGFLAAIFLTGSRGSLIAASIALLLVPASLMRFSVVSRIAVGVGLLVAVGLSVAFLPTATWDRVRSIPGELSQGTLTKRTDIWAAGLEAYRQHPFAGVGVGAFEASVYKQLDIAYVAHNSYLSVLVELGAVGLILFAALLVALFYTAFSLPGLSRPVWVVLLLTWSIAVFSVTFEHRKPTWFLFGLLIAHSATLERRGRHGRVRTSAGSVVDRLQAA